MSETLDTSRGDAECRQAFEAFWLTASHSPETWVAVKGAREAMRDMFEIAWWNGRNAGVDWATGVASQMLDGMADK